VNRRMFLALCTFAAWLGFERRLPVGLSSRAQNAVRDGFDTAREWQNGSTVVHIGTTAKSIDSYGKMAICDSERELMRRCRSLGRYAALKLCGYRNRYQGDATFTFLGRSYPLVHVTIEGGKYVVRAHHDFRVEAA
jgi:hypothetical protein